MTKSEIAKIIAAKPEGVEIDECVAGAIAKVHEIEEALRENNAKYTKAAEQFAKEMEALKRRAGAIQASRPHYLISTQSGQYMPVETTCDICGADLAKRPEPFERGVT